MEPENRWKWRSRYVGVISPLRQEVPVLQKRLVDTDFSTLWLGRSERGILSVDDDSG